MLMQLTRVVAESTKQTGLEINTSTKKNLGGKIGMQFSTSLEKLAIKVAKLQETVKKLTEKDLHKQVHEVAGKLCHKIR